VKRRALPLALVVALTDTARADASAPTLASYYERHMALVGGAAHGWTGRHAPRVLRRGVSQVGVGKDVWFALDADATLVAWTDARAEPVRLMRGVARFAAGESGWFAIDRDAVLWRGRSIDGQPPQRIADGVVDACIGDGADYFVKRDGSLWVRGLAHRGQYGDGLLKESADFVPTASDVVAVRAHTGHAIALLRNGRVVGTGGNRYGPLGTHGLGDKADRWGTIFVGAAAIATGSRHSAAIRADASLWVWGEGFGIEPIKLLERANAVAAGDSATIAFDAHGALWQWQGAGAPRQVVLG
jgi:hypothetical protein